MPLRRRRPLSAMPLPFRTLRPAGPSPPNHWDFAARSLPVVLLSLESRTPHREEQACFRPLFYPESPGRHRAPAEKPSELHRAAPSCNTPCPGETVSPGCPLSCLQRLGGVATPLDNRHV